VYGGGGGGTMGAGAGYNCDVATMVLGYFVNKTKCIKVIIKNGLHTWEALDQLISMYAELVTS
jgi:hypothetical protein